MTIIATSDYPAVRAAIDIYLDAQTLPDAVIALDIYQGAAERVVMARVPGWETLQGDDLARVETAVVYLTASLICPAIPAIFRETMPDYAYQAHRADPATQAAQLARRAEQALFPLTGPAVAMPPFFTLALPAVSAQPAGGVTGPNLPFSQRLRGAAK